VKDRVPLVDPGRAADPFEGRSAGLDEGHGRGREDSRAEEHREGEIAALEVCGHEEREGGRRDGEGDEGHQGRADLPLQREGDREEERRYRQRADGRQTGCGDPFHIASTPKILHSRALEEPAGAKRSGCLHPPVLGPASAV